MLLKKYGRLGEFVIAFLSFGIGQKLLSLGLVRPWAEDRQLVLTLILIGGLIFTFGLVILVRLAIWFYRHYNQKNRVLKVLTYSLIFSILIGLIIGVLGQVLYNNSSVSYEQVKVLIWGLTAYFQMGIKLTVIYAFIRFYQGKEFTFKDTVLRNLYIIGAAAITVVIIFSMTLPQVSEIVQYLVDTGLILGVVYYFIIVKKSNILGENL